MNLPELRIADWRPTKETLHLYAQIAGKVRLASSPPRNHWWHAPLYVGVRGLTTGPMHRGGTTFEIAFDFVDHELVVRTMSGLTQTFALRDGLTVADFDARLHAALAELGVDVAIQERPFEVPGIKTPFDQDTEHASWDRDAVARFHRALDWSASVFEEFSGWFVGKSSPVQLMWQSLDLSLTRFSGRPGLATARDHVNREAYAQEVILFGFWMGDDHTYPDASYYVFMVPEPKGLRSAPLVSGEWSKIGLAVLPYETVRNARDPREFLLAFLQSAYEAAAGLAGWDIAALASAWCPTVDQLRET
ncbi:MAG TPA: DUF5996 family protein [Candidatus Dormibacteraeota bacterium]|nr:DUF5996 family protein [Candidatus Dormibacteraeota bacterium]